MKGKKQAHKGETLYQWVCQVYGHDGVRSMKGYTVGRWGYEVLEHQCVCEISHYPRAELRSYYIQDQIINLKLLSRQEAFFQRSDQFPRTYICMYKLADLLD